jgi:hypothetical protein
MWEILGQICGCFVRHRSFNGGQQLISSFIRETGSLSPSIFSSLGHSKNINRWRDVRWRSPVHSNVCKLDISLINRQVREGSSNGEPSMGKDSTPEHGPLISRLVSMPIEVRDMLLNNFSQFSILSVLMLGGKPPSGNVSISGQLCILSSCNFGRRVFR